MCQPPEGTAPPLPEVGHTSDSHRPERHPLGVTSLGGHISGVTCLGGMRLRGTPMWESTSLTVILLGYTRGHLAGDPKGGHQ